MDCQGCRFWLEQGSAGQGLCRRFPPVLTQILPGQFQAMFPAMQPEGWCGEHAPKEIAQ